MNKILKVLPAFPMALGFAALVGCGDDDSSSSSFNVENSFEVVTSKMTYQYDDGDSTFLLYRPVCKEGSLGNLRWMEKQEDPDTLKAYLDKKTAVIVSSDDETTQKFDYDGGKFPAGLMAKDMDGEIYSGYRLEKDGSMKSVFVYDGECFAQDMKANMFEENETMDKFESAMARFYSLFTAIDDSVIGSDEMLKNIRAASCDELTLFDDLVSIKLSELYESTGRLNVSYGNSSCELSFKIRYASNESDCKAAYEDFKDDKSSDEFNFSNYWITKEYDEYCIARLVLDMKQDQGISLGIKKEAAVSTKDFADAIVDVLFSAVK